MNLGTKLLCSLTFGGSGGILDTSVNIKAHNKELYEYKVRENYRRFKEMEDEYSTQLVEEVQTEVTGCDTATFSRLSGQVPETSEDRIVSNKFAEPQEKGRKSFNMSQMVELLFEDRKRREEEQFEDRRRWEEERKRKEVEHYQQIKQMELQLEMMRSLMERSQVREDDFARRAKGVQDQL